MVQIISVAEIHGFTGVNVKLPAEDLIVEVATWEPGQVVVSALNPVKAMYTKKEGWIRADGSSFPEGVEVHFWRLPGQEM